MLLLFLTGCGGAAEPQPSQPAAPITPSVPSAGQGETGAAAPSPKSVELFAAADIGVKFNLTEGGSASGIEEYLLRDGERVIAGYDGYPYATWFLRDSGVWRMDPKGGGALLQYLPPVLASGSAWHQVSGDATVWFRLDEAPCQQVTGAAAASQPCWQLSVLNRGERTAFTFAPGLGPVRASAENFTQSAGNFDKIALSVLSRKLTAEQRDAYVSGGVNSPAAEGPVTHVSVDEFEAALAGAQQTTPVTGQQPAPSAGQATAAPAPAGNGQQTERNVTVNVNGKTEHFTIRDQWPKGETYHRYLLIGETNWPLSWGPKMEAVLGTGFDLDQNGKITVSWDLGDPARHTWIREYQLTCQQSKGDACTWVQEAVSSRFVPQAAALRAPANAEELVEAAFIAFWFDLNDELSSYFASPELMQPLTGHPDIMKPKGGPGTVEVGTVTLEQWSDGRKVPKVQPGTVASGGTIGFKAEVRFYEGGQAVWGRVTFGTDGAGHLVVTDLVVDGVVAIGM